MNPDPKQDFWLDQVLARDQRYPRAAYEFVATAVQQIARIINQQQQQQQQQQPSGRRRHNISGQELLHGLRQLLLQQFGCMTFDILEFWNITCTEDFGNIVFNLVEARMLSISDKDKIEDFQDGYDFYEAFVMPFQPHKPARALPELDFL